MFEKNPLFQKPFLLVFLIFASQLFLTFIILYFVFPKENLSGARAFLTPEDSLALEGQIIYYQEGCQYCHTQNLRPFDWELHRFTDFDNVGYFSKPEATEYYFESPRLRGFQRVGPDLSRTASKWDEAELKALLKNTRSHKKNLKKTLHQYNYLFEEEPFPGRIYSWKIRALLQMRIPFSDNYQRSSFSIHQANSRGDLLVSYLLSRGKKQKELRSKFYRKD